MSHTYGNSFDIAGTMYIQTILSFNSRILFNMVSMPTVVEPNEADLKGSRVLLKIQSSKKPMMIAY